MLSTVHHAGEVLDLFSAEQPEWGVTAVARQLGIPKSRAHELLASLSAIGLLEHVPHGSYRLGWRGLALACAKLRTSALRSQAEPVMRELVEEHTATVLVVVWDRGWLLCVCRQEPTPSVHRNRPSVGARFRDNGSAAAKVLMAHRPACEIASFAEAYARNGNRSQRRPSLEAELQRVRRRGYAAGRDAGPSSPPALAAPVRDAGDNVIAALSIAPAKLQSDADVAVYDDVIVSAAGRISQALCHVRSRSATRGLSPSAGAPDIE